MSFIEQAIVKRASGGQVSRTKSLLAAAAAGFAAAGLIYKLLRGGDSKEHEEQDEENEQDERDEE